MEQDRSLAFDREVEANRAHQTRVGVMRAFAITQGRGRYGGGAANFRTLENEQGPVTRCHSRFERLTS